MAVSTGARLLVFRVAQLACATEVAAVREILPVPAATRVPGAPPAVVGLINIRGTLVTLVDARRALGQPADDSVGTVILLEVASRTVGFAVDEVLDFITALPGEPAERED